jgi:O-Antigen ligase
MSSYVAAFRPSRRGARPADPAMARERSIRRRVGIIWGLLVFNVLTYGGTTVIPIPYRIGQAMTQVALQVALVMALSLNRKVLLRPNVFLFLVSLLLVDALITVIQPPFHRGTLYRTVRLTEFIAALWLLTPWWGRRDLLLVRYHLAAMSAVLGSVLLGLLVAPGAALRSRLGGVIWPMPATQVAHYAAIMTGLVTILWICGLLRGRIALVAAVVSVTILILTHTRTALVGMIAGILVSGLSLIVARTRARKLFATLGALAGIAVIAVSGVITAWLARGQSTSQLTGLSGRTQVWSELLAFPRDGFQEIFGFGLSNASFNGFAVDSNWLVSYQEQGLFGVVICAALLLFLLVAAYFQPRGVQRALALFLVTYCLVASYTEVGFTDASTYLLDLTLAASLLVPPLANVRTHQLVTAVTPLPGLDEFSPEVPQSPGRAG